METSNAKESLTQMFEYHGTPIQTNYMYGKWEDIDPSQVIVTEDGYKVVDMKLEKQE